MAASAPKTFGAISSNGYPWSAEQVKTTSYTIGGASFTLAQMAIDNNNLFTNFGASGTVTFTLPSLANAILAGGLCCYFMAVVASQSLAVTAPAGKLVGFNNAAATTITFSTSSTIIGAWTRIYLNAAGTFYIAQVGYNTPTMS